MTDGTRLGADYWKLWSASVVSNLGDGLSTVAYPWLASAITRDPLQISLVAVATRLPWLLFTLPAGVITDRVDRRRLIVSMDAVRFVLTLGVALFVIAVSGDLLDPLSTSGAGRGADPLYLAVLYLTAFAFGAAEVLRDNSAQTLMPALVSKAHLERANGRLWGAEMVMNSFAGPPLGGILLAVSFSLPFFVDAATFAVSAALIAAIGGSFTAADRPIERTPFRVELAEGVRWLWRHRLLRGMAIVLGVMNAMIMMALATYVLFVQEILGLEAAAFGALLTAGAAGGVAGSFAASRVAAGIGPGASLFAALLLNAGAYGVTGLTSSAALVWAMFVVSSFGAVLWNVVTVSLRQTIIPDRLLGRVNGVYRFFAWGMMPVGSFLGGAIVALAQPLAGREWALRIPFLFAGAVFGLLYLLTTPLLNTRRIEAAKSAVQPDSDRAVTDS